MNVITPRRSRSVRLVMATSLALAACGPPTGSPASDSAAPSGAPSGGSAAAAACDPAAAPGLIGPDGRQVVLGDGPGGMSSWLAGSEMESHLRQIGDCIWIVSLVDVEEGETPFLTTFHGRLGSDFLIVGTFADINGERVPGHNHGDAVLRVTFDGPDTVLVEDRTSTGPPGCFGGDGPCPAPLELRRAP